MSLFPFFPLYLNLRYPILQNLSLIIDDVIQEIRSEFIACDLPPNSILIPNLFTNKKTAGEEAEVGKKSLRNLDYQFYI